MFFVHVVGKLLGTVQTRIGGNIFFNIRFIFTHIIPIIVETCSLFPHLLFLIFIILTTCIAIYIFFTNTKKLALRNSIEFILLIIVSIMSSFVTFLLGLTSFYTGRLRFSIGATMGLLFIYLYCKTNIFEKKKLITYITIFVFVFYSFINTFNYIYLMQQHKKVNELEKKEAGEIVSYVEQYEAKNNIEVTQITDVSVSNYPYRFFYTEINNKSILVISGIKSIENYGVIHFYTGRIFEKVELTPDMNTEFMKLYDSGKLENNYICIGNTLYMII